MNCNAIDRYQLHLAKLWIRWRCGLRVINPGFLQNARQKVWRAIHFKLLLSVLESNFCLENVSVWFDNECLTFDLWQTWRDPLHTWELEIKLNGQILFSTEEMTNHAKQTSLVNITLWVIADIIIARSFKTILSLCFCDIPTSVRRYRKSPNFTKLLRVFFDPENFILSNPCFWKWVLQEKILLFPME